MSGISKAVGDIRRFAEMFKGIIELADELDKVGSLQQANTEAQTLLGTLRAGIEKLKKQSEDATTSVSASNEKAQHMVAEAKMQVDALIQEATDTATEITTAAKTEARKIVSNAHDKRVDVENQRDKAQQELANINQSITQARKTLADSDKQLDAIRKKVA